MFEFIQPPDPIECPINVADLETHRRDELSIIAIESPPGAHELRINGVDGVFPGAQHACMQVENPAKVVMEYSFHDRHGELVDNGVYIGSEMQRLWRAPPDATTIDVMFNVDGRQRPAHAFVPDACAEGDCPLIVGGDLFSADIFAQVAWRLIETDRIQPIILASTFPDFANRAAEYRRAELTGRSDAFEAHLHAFSGFVARISEQYQTDTLYAFGFSNAGEFALNFAAAGTRPVDGVLAVSPYDPDPAGVLRELGSLGVETSVVFGSWEDVPRTAYEAVNISPGKIAGGHAKYLAALAFEAFLLERFAH